MAKVRIVIFVLFKRKVGSLWGKNTSFMITKKEQKWVCVLQSKKKRQEEKAFVVEGKKSVQEFTDQVFNQRLFMVLLKQTHFPSRK